MYKFSTRKPHGNEYDVYSAVMKMDILPFQNGKAVLSELTDFKGDSILNCLKGPLKLRCRLESATGLLESFEARNAHSAELNFARIQGSEVLEPMRGTHFGNPDFYQLSRVGFNNDQTLALVCINNIFQNHLILFELKAQDWQELMRQVPEPAKREKELARMTHAFQSRAKPETRKKQRKKNQSKQTTDNILTAWQIQQKERLSALPESMRQAFIEIDQDLRTAGLLVKNDGLRLSIRPGPHRFEQSVLNSLYDTEHDNASCEIQINEQNDAFYVRRWHCIPGPGPGEFQFQESDPQIVIQKVKDLYFSGPLEHNGWLFPVYNHPHWKQRLFQKAIQAPTRFSWHKWLKFKSRIERKEHWSWVRHKSRLGLRWHIEAVSSNHRNLLGRIRYDGTQFFIIDHPEFADICKVFLLELSEKASLGSAVIHEAQRVLANRLDEWETQILSEIISNRPDRLRIRFIRAISMNAGDSGVRLLRKVLRTDFELVRHEVLFRLMLGFPESNAKERNEIYENHLSRHPDDNIDFRKHIDALMKIGLAGYE